MSPAPLRRSQGLPLPPPRHPAWRVAGWALLGFTLAFTGVQLARGPRSLESGRALDGAFTDEISGKLGTLTELHGDNRLTLRYKTIQGEQRSLRLGGVDGELAEARGQWRFQAPSAVQEGEAWLLSGPVALESVDLAGASAGKGRLEGQGPAMRWDSGRWEALAPLRWESLFGAGRGTWILPAGWTRDLDGRIRADHGPLVWVAEGQPTLRRLEADRMVAEAGFRSGRLDHVKAELADGALEAQRADLSPDALIWPEPLTFRRLDGWTGEAEGGRADRPAPGHPVQQVELRGFKARRALPEGPEQLQSLGVRWTPAGLRLEGGVVWEQPLEGQRLRLQAPRILLREAAGPDLPGDLPPGHARAEGQPVLTWGRRVLGAPRMTLDRRSRRWHLEGPVTGRAEEGTFSAGPGQGSPRAWSFQGPVNVAFVNGGTLRGDTLLWEEAQWTLGGRPATWTRLRERLSGSRIVRKGERLDFPEGLSGALAGSDGDLTLRSGRGESEATEVRLFGGVEVQGAGWRLLADRVTLRLGAGRTVQLVQAQGAVSLRGRLGEGQGEALELEPGPRSVKWRGRVKGLGSAGGGADS